MMKYLIPSKTFLMGEHYALEHGRALIAVHSPCFLFSAEELQLANQKSSFHEKSPAGRLLFMSSSLLQYKMDFQDPHKGAGGFGGSTAEFLGVYATQKKRQSMNEMNSSEGLRELLNTYFKCLDTQASGLDLLAQTQVPNQVCLVDASHAAISLRSFKWAFPDIQVEIYKTPLKVKTHEVLSRNIEKPVEKRFAQEFAPLIEMAKAFEEQSSQGFVAAIKQGYHELFSRDLVCKPTVELCTHLAAQQGVLAVKGCGALGADTLLLVTESGVNTPELTQDLGLKLICRVN